ncbi:MAG TPA: hypothetical protein DEA73_00785 [Peptococcaceae bacterium]|nr:hypothetical protein [Peptococcaceae bacterium]
MDLGVYELIADDLALIEEYVDEEVKDYVRPPLNRWDQNFLPSLVVLSGRHYGYEGRRLLSMAAALKLIFLGTFLHAKAGTEPARSALWGDYLYTKFFALLCRDGNLEFLPYLTEVICRINLRFIHSVARKEDPDAATVEVCGLLGGLATRVGSALAGAPADEVEGWYDVGHALGLLWGMQNCGRSSLTPRHLAEAEEALKKVPDLTERKVWQEMLLDLCKPATVWRMAP